MVKQQLNTLKEMDKGILLSKIIFNHERSKRAYNLYFANKNYAQALRIFKANVEIYNLIISNCEVWSQTEPIIDYLFHLEDWFEQFKNLEKTISPKLEDKFVFERMDTYIPFPKDILQYLIKI
jgi:hypothetical protein